MHAKMPFSVLHKQQKALRHYFHLVTETLSSHSALRDVVQHGELILQIGHAPVHDLTLRYFLAIAYISGLSNSVTDKVLTSCPIANNTF